MAEYSRRDFLGMGAAAGLGALGLPAFAQTSGPEALLPHVHLRPFPLDCVRLTSGIFADQALYRIQDQRYSVYWQIQTKGV